MPTKKELQKQINSIKETIKSDYISYIFLKNRVGFIEECFCCKAVNNMETIKKGDTLNPNLYSIVFLKDGVPVSPQIDMTGFYEYKTKTLGVSLDTSDRLHIAKMNGITDFTHYVLPHSLKLNPDSLEGMDVKTLKWCQFNPKTFEIIPSELKESDLCCEKQLHKEIIKHIGYYGFYVCESINKDTEKYELNSHDNLIELLLSFNTISLFVTYFRSAYRETIAKRYKIERIEQLDFLLLNGRIGGLIERCKNNQSGLNQL
jgi:hypothetical protein